MKTKIPHIRHILLAEDLSMDSSHELRSNAVKDQVIALASRLGNQVDLTHVEDLSSYPVSISEFRPFLSRFLQNQASLLKRMSRSAKVGVRPVLVQGNVVQKLLELSRSKTSYELLALGTHGRKGAARWLLGSVAEEVIRNSDAPVMVVGPEAQKHPSSISKTGEMTLLVAIDLGQSSKITQHYAVKLAKRLNARVVLFHSIREALHPILQTAYSSHNSRAELNALVESIRGNARKELETAKLAFSAAGISVTAQIDEQTADVGQAVLKLARTLRPDLIIMGTHGRNLLTQAFLGSSVREVILGAQVPVITVHSARKPKKRAESDPITYSISEKEIMGDLIEHRRIAG